MPRSGAPIIKSMDQADPQAHSGSETDRQAAAYRVGCVSYLNARPLIAGPDDEPGIQVRTDVSARLLADLESGDVDVALCPVFDFFSSEQDLSLVPVGAIGCEGPTLTVRLYSQVPIDEITTLHADTDSHTSVALAQVLSIITPPPLRGPRPQPEGVVVGRIRHRANAGSAAGAVADAGCRGAGGRRARARVPPSMTPLPLRGPRPQPEGVM